MNLKKGQRLCVFGETYVADQDCSVTKCKIYGVDDYYTLNSEDIAVAAYDSEITFVRIVEEEEEDPYVDLYKLDDHAVDFGLKVV